MSSFFLTLAEHFKIKKKIIHVIIEGYSLLKGTIRKATKQQRFPGRELSRRELSGKEMSGWESSGGNVRVGNFFRWEMSRGKLPGRNCPGEVYVWESTLNH